MISNSGTTSLGLYDFKRQIDAFGGVDYFRPTLAGGYLPNARVMLANGEVVQNSTNGNLTNDPNSDMTGWLRVDGIRVFNTLISALSANLSDGDFIQTAGYRNIFDGGGSLYSISATANDYSIPLNSGLNAVFCDSFDIRKFGIQNSKTLNQSAEISRMVSYADSRIYEIDFHGYAIMNPEIYQYTTSRDTLIKGMGFNFVHKIKNLHISNNKTKTLVMGTSCIIFSPKQNARGKFSLENVTFDPFVADYQLNYTTPSGEYDGNMLGFYAFPHPDWVDEDRTVKTDYDCEFKNIHFESPAVSYNLAAAGLQFNRIEASNLTGQYWGLYLFPFANDVEIRRVNGVLRDDLDTGTRLLVKNLIQEEAEIGSGTISRKGVIIDDLKAVNFSNGQAATVFKHHSVGNENVDYLKASNIDGHLEIFVNAGLTTRFNSIEFADCNSQNFTHYLNVNSNKVTFKNSISKSVLFQQANTHVIDAVEGYNSEINGLSISGSGFTQPLSKLKLVGCSTTNDTYGLYRNSGFHINEIELINHDLNSIRLIEGSFDVLRSQGLKLNTDYENVIYLRRESGSTGKAYLYDTRSTKTAGIGSFFFLAFTEQALTVEMYDAALVSRPSISNATLKEVNVYPPKPLSVFADNSAALAGGLVAGSNYRTSTGQLMIVF